LENCLVISFGIIEALYLLWIRNRGYKVKYLIEREIEIAREAKA
jgi:hypothetical protein